MNYVTSIPRTTVVVKTQAQSALTTADRDAIKAHGGYYFNAGGGYHVFGQLCGNADCLGVWKITLHESAAEFGSAVERAKHPEIACPTCQRKGNAGPSLIQYRAKSASSGGNGGSGGRARSHRSRRSNTGHTQAQLKAMQRDIARMSDWLHSVETGEIDAPADMVARVKATLAAYIETVAMCRKTA